MNKDDIKRLIKADEYIKVADKLVEEATTLYLETFKIKSDTKLSEKEIKTKCNKLENEANKKQLKANEYYNIAYDTKIGIYKLYITKIIKDNKDSENTENLKIKIEEINEYLIKAKEYEIKANKIKDDKEKILLLNNARDQRIKAFDIAEKTYKLCYELSDHYLAEDNEYKNNLENNENDLEKTSVDEKSVYGEQEKNVNKKEIEINEVLLQNLKKYVSDTIKDIEFLTPEKISELLTYTPEQLRNFWYKYYFIEYRPELKTNVSFINDTNKIVNNSNFVSQSNIDQHSTSPVSKDEASIPGQKNDKNKKYRIQIYAGKNNLDQNVLRKIYYGNKKLEYIYEDGLYKYSLGDFESFKDAEKFKNEAGLTNAVVLEYDEEKEFQKVYLQFSDNSTESPDKVQQEKYLSGYLNDNRIIFRVQVAANRFRLNLNQLYRIYNENYTIEEVVEDDWYKYQTIGIGNFEKALYILKNIPINGVFISAYQNNVKIDLQDAIKKTKNVKEPYYEFHVQILASKRFLNNYELVKYYKGSYPVSIFFEDNLYKYRIKAGSSYERASEIKLNCNVSDAFIVVYEDGIKIPLYKYLNKIKTQTKF